MDARMVFDRIINLNDCEDGLYIVKCVNKSHDWEAGHVDDYDYKLIEVNDE